MDTSLSQLWETVKDREAWLTAAPQVTCLENPMDGGAWWAAVYGVTESATTEAT